MHTEGRPSEDTERREPSVSQEESPHHKLNPAKPWSWAFQPPELWKSKLLLCKPASLWYFYDSPSWLRYFLIHSGLNFVLTKPQRQLLPQSSVTWSLSKARIYFQSSSCLTHALGNTCNKTLKLYLLPWLLSEHFFFSLSNFSAYSSPLMNANVLTRFWSWPYYSGLSLIMCWGWLFPFLFYL